MKWMSSPIWGFAGVVIGLLAVIATVSVEAAIWSSIGGGIALLLFIVVASEGAPLKFIARLLKIYYNAGIIHFLWGLGFLLFFVALPRFLLSLFTTSSYIAPVPESMSAWTVFTLFLVPNVVILNRVAEGSYWVGWYGLEDFLSSFFETFTRHPARTFLLILSLVSSYLLSRFWLLDIEKGYIENYVLIPLFDFLSRFLTNVSIKSLEADSILIIYLVPFSYANVVFTSICEQLVRIRKGE